MKAEQKRQYDEGKADQLVWNKLFLEELRETKSETKQVKDELQEIKHALREFQGEFRKFVIGMVVGFFVLAFWFHRQHSVVRTTLSADIDQLTVTLATAYAMAKQNRPEGPEGEAASPQIHEAQGLVPNRFAGFKQRVQRLALQPMSPNVAG